MSNADFLELAAEAVKNGNWIIRADNDGKSRGGFQWEAQGEWTAAPNWDDKPVCGGGLHGQDKNCGGMIMGNRLVFCDTDGDHVAIGDNKVKVRRARILMINDLPDGLTVGGWLDLSGCTGLTSLPDGLTVGGKIY